MIIFPFLAILRLGAPIYGQALTEGGFGEHFYGPPGSSLDPTTTQKKSPVQSEVQLRFWGTSALHYQERS